MILHLFLAFISFLIPRSVWSCFCSSIPVPFVLGFAFQFSCGRACCVSAHMVRAFHSPLCSGCLPLSAAFVLSCDSPLFFCLLTVPSPILHSLSFSFPSPSFLAIFLRLLLVLAFLHPRFLTSPVPSSFLRLPRLLCLLVYVASSFLFCLLMFFSFGVVVLPDLFLLLSLCLSCLAPLCFPRLLYFISSFYCAYSFSLLFPFSFASSVLFVCPYFCASIGSVSC